MKLTITIPDGEFCGWKGGIPCPLLMWDGEYGYPMCPLEGHDKSTFLVHDEKSSYDGHNPHKIGKCPACLSAAQPDCSTCCNLDNVCTGKCPSYLPAPAPKEKP